MLSSAKAKHEEAAQLYAEGRYADASAALQEALQEEVTSELTNDWAAAELACGRTAAAQVGFSRALALDPSNVQAAANLGVLLATLGRADEAIPYLEKASLHSDEKQRATIMNFLSACRSRAAREALDRSRAESEKLSRRLRPTPVPAVPAVAPTLRPPVYVGNNRALLCTTNHCKMYVDTTDLLIAPWLLIHGEWEPEETEVFKKLLKPGDVFVDVGANIGYYTLLAVRCGASRVYSFEPQENTYELLGKNVIINWMTSVVTFERLAVFSHTTNLDFFARNAYPGNSSIGVSSAEQLQKWFDTADRVRVPAVSLDDYFSDKPGQIDLLKVDVEGAEAAVFEGARRILSSNPDIRILCEWSPDQMATAKQNSERLVQLWAELGFRAFALHTGLEEVSLKSLPGSGYMNLLLLRKRDNRTP
jgi:FkbM family methyltransferase